MVGDFYYDCISSICQFGQLTSLLSFLITSIITALRRKLPQEEIGNMGSPAIMSELLKHFMQRILMLIDLLVSCSSSKYEK